LSRKEGIDNGVKYLSTKFLITFIIKNMKIIIKTLQGKQLPLEVEETYTVSKGRSG